MNIAVSPDPALPSAPDDVPITLKKDPNGFGETPFADLLSPSPDSSQDEAPHPGTPKTSPRKQPTDTSDPALTTLLPFLAQQLQPTPPAPALPPPSGGEDFGISTNASQTNLQRDPNISAATQNLEPFVQSPNRWDPSAGAGLSLLLASQAQNQIQQTDDRDASGMDSAEPKTVEQSAQRMPKSISGISGLKNDNDAAAPSEQATLPGTNYSPAEFTPGAIPTATPAKTLESDIPAGSDGEQTLSGRNTNAKSTPNADGTSTAMQLRAMPEQFIERTQKAKPDGPATASATVQNRAATAPAVPARIGMERRLEPEPTPEKKTLIRADAAVERGQPLPSTVHTQGSVTATTEADATAAVRITRQTMDLTEHVRAMGRDHVEVQMRLRDGEEVTVSLRLEKGEWKPVFKTDSEALCRALEQNWNRAVAQPSVQAVRFGTPVFESQQTQTDSGRNGNSNGHQQPDSRDRSFNRREQEAAFAVPAQPARTTLTNPTPIRSAATPAVQIYA